MLSVALIVSLVLTGCAELAAPPAEPTEPAEPAEPETPLPDRILFAPASPVVSSYYPAKMVIADLGERGMGVPITVVASDGSARTLQMIFDNDAAVGGSGMTPYYQMLNGMGAWEGNPLPNEVRVLYHYCDFDLTFAVGLDSGITCVDDIAGKKITVGSPMSETTVMTRMSLEALGIEFETLVGTSADSIIAFKDRRADVYPIVVSGRSLSGSHLDIMSKRPVTFVGFTDEEVERVQAKYEYISFKKIPAGHYEQLPDLGELNQITSRALIMCRADFPEEFAYKWTKYSIEHFGEVGEVHEGIKETDPSDTPSILVPGLYLHPGAIRYYREVGLAVNDANVPPEMK